MLSTSALIGLLFVALAFLFIFLQMPIGIAMGLAGFLGFTVLRGVMPAFHMVKVFPFSTFATYEMSLLCLFILMGELAFAAGLSKDLYSAARAWLGRLPGGLSIATIGACGGFAAICGSSAATAATLCPVAFPEMKKYGYDSGLATASIAAGGTLGILIPPSMQFVIYGIITEQSIGKLFIAGVIPGILQLLLFAAMIYILVRCKPQLAPPGPKTTFKEKIVSLKGAWAVMLLFVLVIGGIYAGLFTATEAAGMGAFGAFAIGVVTGRLSWQDMKKSLRATVKTSAMIFMIIMGAMILNSFLALSRIPTELATLITGISSNRYIICALVVLVYALLGCVMDVSAMVLLTVPIFYPLMIMCGFDPIWFGVIIVMVCELAAITPPFGMNVFIVSGMVKEVPMYTVFRGLAPFVIVDLLLIVIMVIFPQLALTLPRMMQ